MSAKTVGPDGQVLLRDDTKLATTDLASVPALLRWFTNTYGVYTPAALIHDRLIPSHEGSAITDELADRYFRFMLGAVGVPRFKRYIMWTAVAMRTRWFSKQRYKRVLLIIWGATSLLGITALVASLSAILFDTGLPVGSPREVLGVSLVAPVILSRGPTTNVQVRPPPERPRVLGARASRPLAHLGGSHATT